MQRRLISGRAPLEPVVGYSRAVAVDGRVFVSGTAPIPPDGSEPPEGAYAQAGLCLEIVLAALAEAGAQAADVARTRIYLVDAAAMGEVGRAHAEVFAEIRPATTAVVVKGLLDPRWLVEVEADAIVTARE